MKWDQLEGCIRRVGDLGSLMGGLASGPITEEEAGELGRCLGDLARIGYRLRGIKARLEGPRLGLATLSAAEATREMGRLLEESRRRKAEDRRRAEGGPAHAATDPGGRPVPSAPSAGVPGWLSWASPSRPARSAADPEGAQKSRCSAIGAGVPAGEVAEPGLECPLCRKVGGVERFKGWSRCWGCWGEWMEGKKDVGMGREHGAGGGGEGHGGPVSAEPGAAAPVDPGHGTGSGGDPGGDIAAGQHGHAPAADVVAAGGGAPGFEFADESEPPEPCMECGGFGGLGGACPECGAG